MVEGRYVYMFCTDAQFDLLNNRMTVTQRAVQLFNWLSRCTTDFDQLHNQMPVTQQVIPVELKLV